MKLFLIIITSHFLIGFSGILLVNRKLPDELKQHNLIKYFVYLMIFLVVLSSVMINKNLFLTCMIIIFSIGLFELLNLGKKTGRNPGTGFLVLSLAIYALICIFFALFIFVKTEIIIFTYAMVIIFDGACQIAGQLTGKRKILPVISPGKTFEGLAGGSLITIATSVMLHSFARITPVQAFVLGILICFASFSGDMLASIFKRAHDAKDFSSAIPAHGGFLDRFDSFLMAGAMIGLLSLSPLFQFA